MVEPGPRSGPELLAPKPRAVPSVLKGWGCLVVRSWELWLGTLRLPTYVGHPRRQLFQARKILLSRRKKQGVPELEAFLRFPLVLCTIRASLSQSWC